MESLPEFVGTLHIFLGPYRGNPIALYLQKDSNTYQIAPRMYPWNQTVGVGENPNKAAADFEEKWKKNNLSPEMYTGPHWEGGIKPEKPKPVPPPKPAAPPAKPKAEAEAKTEQKPEPPSSPPSPTPSPLEAEKPKDPPPPTS